MVAPLVSVLVPTLNRRAVVTGAVESALAQTVPDLEVIVVDDGGSDGTLEHLGERFHAEPRVKLIRQANRGLAGARNRALEASTGRFVGLLDDDDRWLPTFVERQVALLEAQPGAWVACANGRPEVHRAGRPADLVSWPGYRPDLDHLALFTGGWSVPSGWMLRGDQARALRFDERFRRCEDHELLLRVCAAGGRIAMQPEALFLYADAHDGPGEARLTADRAAMIASLRTALVLHQHEAPDPRAVRRHLQKLEREEVRAHLEQGRAGEVRRLATRWLLRRPFDRAAWHAWWRSRRARPQGTSASASTSINASSS
jgi:GT2 family glycosyltransferase